jgi:hypothetical protein
VFLVFVIQIDAGIGTISVPTVQTTLTYDKMAELTIKTDIFRYHSQKVFYHPHD